MTTTLCLMGPTASGKSALALMLVQACPIEIITVDSAQVYRGMDIGTAKPSAAEQALVPHHLLDVCDPAESYSAARFAEEARALMAAIRARGHVPVLVGGTMLYYKALIEGLSPLPQADPALRAELEAWGQRDGWSALHAELVRRDPQAAARIHPNDPQRLVRALEVCRMSGKTLSELQGQAAPQTDERFCCMALAPTDRAVLHQRIADRFDAMLADGLIDEVAALYQRGDLDLAMPSMRCVGYRQVWEYLDGQIDRATMREQGVAATRQLAKRQITWLRSWPGLTWLPERTEAAFDTLRHVIC